MVQHFITGSPGEIREQWLSYLESYPNLQYGTRIHQKESGSLLVYRFQNKEECRRACLHEVATDPLTRKGE